MSKEIKLISQVDGIQIISDSNTCKASGLLKNLIEDFSDENQFEIPDISGEVLKEAISFLGYMRTHQCTVLPKPLSDYDLSIFLTQYESEFLNKYNGRINELLKLINAANYLDIQPLLEITCAKAATIVKDFDSQTFAEVFQIEQDLTDEEVAKIEEDFNKQKEEERSQRNKEFIELGTGVTKENSSAGK